MQNHSVKVKVKDDLFNIDTISQYFLCLKISTNYLEVSVFDTKIDRCVAYEYHNLFTESESALTTVLTNFIKSHSFLHIANWKAVYFMTCGLQYSFVPEEYHHANYSASYLRLTADIDKTPFNFYHTEHLGQNCFSHFAVSQNIANWAKNIYRDKSIVWIHQTGAFVEGLTKTPDKLDFSNLHILQDKNSVCIVNFKNGKLNFANSFVVTEVSDALYFVMLALKEVGINQLDAKIWLYGDMEINKGLETVLPNYVSQVKNAPRPKNQNFGYRFDEVNTGQGYDVFSAYYFTK
jgi:hypothetical protein